MKLDDEEQDILAGKAGPVPQQALKRQVKVGEFFGAKDFVPVTQAHIMMFLHCERYHASL